MREVSDDGLAVVLSGLHEGVRVVASGNFAVPFETLRILDHGLERYRLFMLNAPEGVPDRPGVALETSFVGPGMRGRATLDYVPSRLSMVPMLFRTTLPPDVLLLHTTPPRAGRMSLGIEVNILPAAIEAVRARGGVIVAQVNPRMPYTYGDAEIDADLVDYALVVEGDLVSPPPSPEIDDTAADIGRRVAGFVSDGATLQLGIGAVPDATVGALMRRRGLRVWSEMFGDGVRRLEEAGALDRDKPVTASFCFGSPELYEWVDGNPRIHMLRTEQSNDPGVIAERPMMISINTALQVDLFGQANACRIRKRIYSGIGGQTDFVTGALHSPGGKAIIAMRSWHPKADRSAIVGVLEEPTTSYQHSAIVTEQGVAEIWGYGEREQARHLIERTAHPDARPRLREEAGALGLR